MARLSFNDRITSVSGVSISSSGAVTSDMARQYILDGVSDVVRSLFKKIPVELDQFCITEDFISTPITINSGLVISMKRKVGVFIDDEGNTVNDYRPATKTSVSNFQRTKDTSSLLYQSKYNPVYIVEKTANSHDGDIVLNVSPSISSNFPVKVTYINMVPKGSIDGSNHEDLDPSIHKYLENVPETYLHLIVLYASI